MSHIADPALLRDLRSALRLANTSPFRMPLTALICPHCDQNVEMNVTSVTRSRECPNCGKLIMLQLTLKEDRTKRKALLMPVQEYEEAADEHLHANGYEPRSLEGDVHARMMHDPEVQHNIRKLAWGGGIVLGSIVLLTIAHFFGWWEFLGARATKLGRVITATPTVPVAEDPSDSRATKTDAKTPRPNTNPESILVTAPSEDAPSSTPGDSPEELQKASLAVQAFLKAKDVEERLGLVRDRKLMEPKIRHYYTTHLPGPVPFDKIEKVASPSSAKFLIAFNVSLKGGQSRQALVGKGRDGNYYVDWASFVLYGDMDWPKFVVTRPPIAVTMRVLALPGDRYGGGFADATQFVCVKIINPTDPGGPPLFGYATRNTLVARATEFALRSAGSEPVPLMMRLKFPSLEESNSPDQLWIQELVAEGWLTRGQ